MTSCVENGSSLIILKVGLQNIQGGFNEQLGLFIAYQDQDLPDLPDPLGLPDLQVGHIILMLASSKLVLYFSEPLQDRKWARKIFGLDDRLFMVLRCLQGLRDYQAQ